MNSEKEPLITGNFREEIFALLNLLSNDDCPHPIWDDIAKKIRMSKDEDIAAVERKQDMIKEWALLSILNLVIMAVILEYTGMLQRMPILKYLVRTGINVLIDST